MTTGEVSFVQHGRRARIAAALIGAALSVVFVWLGGHLMGGSEFERNIWPIALGRSIFVLAFVLSGIYYLYLSYGRRVKRPLTVFQSIATGFYLGSMMSICSISLAHQWGLLH